MFLGSNCFLPPVYTDNTCTSGNVYFVDYTVAGCTPGAVSSCGLAGTVPVRFMTMQCLSGDFPVFASEPPLDAGFDNYPNENCTGGRDYGQRFQSGICSILPTTMFFGYPSAKYTCTAASPAALDYLDYIGESCTTPEPAYTDVADGVFCNGYTTFSTKAFCPVATTTSTQTTTASSAFSTSTLTTISTTAVTTTVLTTTPSLTTTPTTASKTWIVNASYTGRNCSGAFPYATGQVSTACTPLCIPNGSSTLNQSYNLNIRCDSNVSVLPLSGIYLSAVTYSGTGCDFANVLSFTSYIATGVCNVSPSGLTSFAASCSSSSLALIVYEGAGCSQNNAKIIESVNNTDCNGQVKHFCTDSYLTNPLELTCPTATAIVGAAYLSSIGVVGGVPPYFYSIDPNPLPAATGMTLNATTGVITGTPTSPLTATSVTIGVTDSFSVVSSKLCSITAVALSTVSPSAASATILVVFSFQPTQQQITDIIAILSQLTGLPASAFTITFANGRMTVSARIEVAGNNAGAAANQIQSAFKANPNYLADRKPGLPRVDSVSLSSSAFSTMPFSAIVVALIALVILC